MSTKKKIGIIVSVFSVLIFTALWFVITDDISQEELGPSPFKVDKSISSENSPELKKIVEIGKAIEGLKEFEEKFDLDLNSPIDTENKLQELLRKNEKVLIQIELDLFKNCKFPEPRIEKDLGLGEIRNIVKLKYYQTMFHILSHDFEEARNKILQLNQINAYLNEKVNCWLFQMVVVACKLLELHGIELLLEQEQFTIDQKINILNIKQIPISSQNIHQIGYFEEGNLRHELDKINQLKEKSLKNYIIVSYTVKSNKTLKIHRAFVLSAIASFERQTEVSLEKLNEKYFQKRLIAYKPNGYGKVMVSMTSGFIPVITKKMLSLNNRQNQFSLAKEILVFKSKTGSLPDKLVDLNLDKKFYLDLFTKEPFLYSKENGILQSIGGNKKNDSVDLTTKILTKKEYFDFLDDGNYRDDFFIYLK